MDKKWLKDVEKKIEELEEKYLQKSEKNTGFDKDNYIAVSRALLEIKLRILDVICLLVAENEE